MALFQRGKKRIWWYEFKYAGRRYRGTTGTSSERLAEKIERKRHREVEASAAGITLEPIRPVLFSVAAKDWLDLKKPTWAEKTYANAAIDIGHLKSALGTKLVTDITDRHISEYITRRRAKGASDKTIRNELGTLRQILKRHKRWAQIKDDIRLPRGREDIGCALTTEQEEALLKGCAASRSRSLLPAVTIALSTGLRSDEIRLLKWKQIDLVHEAITVGRSKTPSGTGRVVPLNQRALSTIRDWAQQFPKRKLDHFVFPSERVGFSGNDEIPQVFDTDPTKPITSWKTAWETAKTSAGVSCRFHDLRHSVVTRLLEAGQPFAVVADLMGWSPGTAVRMAKRYSHIGQSVKRAAMAALDPKPASAPESKGDDAPASASSSTATLTRGPSTLQ